MRTFLTKVAITAIGLGVAGMMCGVSLLLLLKLYLWTHGAHQP